MKKYEVNIGSWDLGEVSGYMALWNMGGLYYDSAKRLTNMFGSYRRLVRRPPSTFIVKSLPPAESTGNHAKLVALEDNNNNILMEIIPLQIRFYLNGKPLIKNGIHYTIGNVWLDSEEVSALHCVYDDLNCKYYFFSSKAPSMELTFDSEYNFTLQNMEFFDGPYGEINKSAVTLAVSSTTAEDMIITASEEIFSSNYQFKYIRIAHDGLWGMAKLGGMVDKKTFTAKMLLPFQSTTPSKDYRFSVWGMSDGYPATATIFKGRMYYANTNTDKKSIWVSKVGDYKNFAPTTRVEVLNEATGEKLFSDMVAADNSIGLTIHEGKQILWLNSTADTVLLGAKEGIFNLAPFKIDEAISPYNYQVNKISSQKNSSLAVSSDFYTFCVDYQQKDIFAIKVVQNQLVSWRHINAQAKHLFNSKIKEILVLDYPSKRLVVLMQDGTMVMANMTFNGDFNDGAINYAWSQHIMGDGEENDSSQSTAKILSIAVSYSTSSHYLWLQVQRYLQEDSRIYLEYISFRDEEFLYSNASIPCYLDCSFIGEMTNNRIANLDDFNNTTLAVVTSDGVYLSSHMVIDGVITIPQEVYMGSTSTVRVSLGYNFNSFYQTQILEDTSLASVGKKKKIEQMDILLYKSLEAIVKETPQEAGVVINSTVVSYKEAKENQFMQIYPNYAYSHNASVVLQQNKPFAMNLAFVKATIAVQ